MRLELFGKELELFGKNQLTLVYLQLFLNLVFQRTCHADAFLEHRFLLTAGLHLVHAPGVLVHEAQRGPRPHVVVVAGHGQLLCLRQLADALAEQAQVNGVVAMGCLLSGCLSFFPTNSFVVLNIMLIFASSIHKTHTDMTAAQMQLNTELFSALQTIASDEGLMKKAVRSLKRIAAKKTSAEGNMSLAELEDIVRQGEEDIKNGNFKVMTLDEIWK